jgi:hypothetical protein
MSVKIDGSQSALGWRKVRNVIQEKAVALVCSATAAALLVYGNGEHDLVTLVLFTDRGLRCRRGQLQLWLLSGCESGM